MSERLRFNLLDQPWIPVTELVTGMPREVGLREVILDAHRFREIVDGSPLTTAALYRLVIAVLHAALDGPESVDAWGDVWDQGHFLSDQINPYLDRWAERFDLFHPEFPFYQRAELEEDEAKPISWIVLTMPTDSGPTLFDHTSSCQPGRLTAAEAGRALVTYQAYIYGGTNTYRKGEDPKFFKYADGSPLFKCVVVIVTGQTLFETLMLNLHRYAPDDEEPMRVVGEDAPAWQRDEPTEAEDRVPNGYRDLLTWQSRRVRLVPRRAANESIIVDRVFAMKGNQFPETWDARSGETMVAYAVRKGAKPTESPWYPVGIRDDRALWRDSGAMFQSIVDHTQRPRSLDWLSELAYEERFADRSTIYEMDAFGIRAKEAKLKAWRHDRMPLPVTMLRVEAQVEAIRVALRFAEDVAGALRFAEERFAELALAPTSDQREGRKPDREKGVKPLAKALALEATYWPRLEAPFFSLVRGIPDDGATDEYGETRFGARELVRWRDEVRRSAFDALRRLTALSETSPRALKAATVAEGVFRARIGRLAAAFNQTIGLDRVTGEGDAA